MGALSVRGVMVASGPHFMKQKEAGLIERVVQIVLQTAFFFPRGTNQSADFCFHQQLLALFRTKQDDERDGFLGKLADLDWFQLLFRFAWLGPCRSLRFSIGHDGGDCTALFPQRKIYSPDFKLAALFNFAAIFRFCLADRGTG
jgi:hypothetical protein